jgi:hypothetical protein
MELFVIRLSVSNLKWPELIRTDCFARLPLGIVVFQITGGAGAIFLPLMKVGGLPMTTL